VLLARAHDAGRPLDREQRDPVGEPARLREVALLAVCSYLSTKKLPNPVMPGTLAGNTLSLPARWRAIWRALSRWRAIWRALSRWRAIWRALSRWRASPGARGSAAPRCRCRPASRGSTSDRWPSVGAARPVRLRRLGLAEIGIEEPPGRREVRVLPGHLDEPQQEVPDPGRAVTEPGVDVARVGVEVPAVTPLQPGPYPGERPRRDVEGRLVAQAVEEAVTKRR
jgi:hypothetical protein